MNREKLTIDPVRASGDGHRFHERWTARRALELIFPKDDLYAIAVEGLSPTEDADPGKAAVEIADLTLYYGKGDNFATCRAQQTLQFKYKTAPGPVTSSYLKKTIQKFAESLVGFEKDFDAKDIEKKLSFSFITNAAFKPHLVEAIECLQKNKEPLERAAKEQYQNLKKWCKEKGVEANRLFAITSFQTSVDDLSTQDRRLQRTLTDWNPGADSKALARLWGLEKLIRDKAGVSGQGNNLVKREDVIYNLGFDLEDLFPAKTEFVDVGAVVKRLALDETKETIEKETLPVFIHAGGGVGKTVFIQSLAKNMREDYETVIFDCFGGGSYRSVDQARHPPKIGLLQIVNELASQRLCDLQLPTDGDSRELLKAARKRLEQAATTIREQSAKKGVLVIIDAADNAQFVADERKEDAFPTILLESLSLQPIEGVKLVLTARTHRKVNVIKDSEVKEFELLPFTKVEAREFLKTRREDFTPMEFATVFARSGGNARVMEYLVESWDENVARSVTQEKITAEDLIQEKCKKIIKAFKNTGWSDDEIKLFFTALWLLPPPIPLDEMAMALGWEESQIKSAVSDLAPMLENQKQGVIFRDEPTETYIQENYKGEMKAQVEIAEGLNSFQNTSMFAAEALPGLLVAMGDSDRAYQLAASDDFPASIQSDYGRRRIRLKRLNAAFKLAYIDRDFDRLLGLTLKLAQVASANEKGDKFVRSCPGMAVSLGDQDAMRRLWQDRSGWRGERHACLTVAHAFLGEMDEAAIRQKNTIDWINGYYRNKTDEDQFDRSGPSNSDLAAVIFFSILKGDYDLVERNLNNWSFSGALSVCQKAITLLHQYNFLSGKNPLPSLLTFASGKGCKSFALQVSLLASKQAIDGQSLKHISGAAGENAGEVGKGVFEDDFNEHQRQQSALTQAALAALLHNSKRSAANIIGTVKAGRLGRFEYGERYGQFRGWPPLLTACITAWAAGKPLKFYHLVPREVEITHKLKLITDPSKLKRYFENLEIPVSQKTDNKGQKKEKQFSPHECDEVVNGIGLVLDLAKPLQDIILQGRKIDDAIFKEYLEKWEINLKLDSSWYARSALGNLSRKVGFGFARIFLRYLPDMSEANAIKLIEILNQGPFPLHDKLFVVSQLTQHSILHNLAGQFANTISEDICRDDDISQRSHLFADLAESLLPMSKDEAQEYFRQGLSQLDQMGGEDWENIYGLLKFAAKQKGGIVKLELGHRLMNLSQLVFQDEPTKFGWALFGRAAAQSIGLQAIYKIFRWSDQEISDFSNGLPQLACFLAKKGFLEPHRAAFFLLGCEDLGWHEWKIGDGLRDLFESLPNKDRQVIWRAVVEKLKFEEPFGGSSYPWESLFQVAEEFQGVAEAEEVDTLKALSEKGRARTDEINQRQNSSGTPPVFAENPDAEEERRKAEEEFEQTLQACNISSTQTVDAAIRKVREDKRLRFRSGTGVIERLREKVEYKDRKAFIEMLTQLVELGFSRTFDLIKDTVEMWAASSQTISENKKAFVEALFNSKGSKLFNLKYSGLSREINKLIEFCGDRDFVLNLVIETIVKEGVELTSEEWLLLAANLCPFASDKANLDALEDFLSGPAAEIADEIGEGPFTPSLKPPSDQNKVVADVTWHLLGNMDTFVRWKAARSIKGLADLGLHKEIESLLECFDQSEIKALVSKEEKFSFLNAQQWLLMGLARACLHHGKALNFLKAPLEQLFARDDIHAVNKIHIARCLQNISGLSKNSPEMKKRWDEIYVPPKGYEKPGPGPKPTKPKIEFQFDYDFQKREISNLARLFGISDAEACDAVARKIQKRWSKAKDMTIFPGQQRYRPSQQDHIETYRESIQKHALLNAATTLMKSKPVMEDRYEPDEAEPWVEWLQEYDVSFEDGSWLSDHKDPVPEQAKQMLIVRIGKKDVLENESDILNKIGLHGERAGQPIPLRGAWRSVDGVAVHISSALTRRIGVIGRCKTFSKKPFHDIWLPTFGSDGEVDRHVRSCEFEPLIWMPERYPIGIDKSDEFATEYPVIRPRLGRALTSKLGLKSDKDNKNWQTEDGGLALKSQVWGQWRPDPDNHRAWGQNEGVVLWAQPDWLGIALSKLNLSLVFHIDFYKHKSYQSYDDTEGLRAVYIALRMGDGALRIWKAKEASKKTHF